MEATKGAGGAEDAARGAGRGERGRKTGWRRRTQVRRALHGVRADRTWPVQDPPLLFGLHVASPDLAPEL